MSLPLLRTVDGIKRFDPVALILISRDMRVQMIRCDISCCALGMAYRHATKKQACTTTDAREYFRREAGMSDDYVYAFYRGFDCGPLVPWNDMSYLGHRDGSMTYRLCRRPSINAPMAYRKTKLKPAILMAKPEDGKACGLAASAVALGWEPKTEALPLGSMAKSSEYPYHFMLKHGFCAKYQRGYFRAFDSAREHSSEMKNDLYRMGWYDGLNDKDTCFGSNFRSEIGQR